MTNLFIPPSFKEGFFGVDNVSIPIPICSTPIVITNIAMHLEKQLRIHLNGALCFTCTQLRPNSQCSSHRSLNDILDIFRIMSPWSVVAAQQQQQQPVLLQWKTEQVANFYLLCDKRRWMVQFNGCNTSKRSTTCAITLKERIGTDQGWDILRNPNFRIVV